jgi:hypothetical protein
MANPAPALRIMPPYAPVDLRELFAHHRERFTGITINISSSGVAQGRNEDFAWNRIFDPLNQPSPAHDAAINSLTDYFLKFIFHSMEGLAEPYTGALVSDQFDYESVSRPATQTLHARPNFRGRARPLPIDDD